MSITSRCFDCREMARAYAPSVIFLTMALCGCAINSDRPQVPPGFILKWDLSTAGSSVAQDFEVKEYRIYRVELIFSPHTRPFDRHASQEMDVFAGDGSLYTDSDGHVSLGTSAKAIGVVIPIHLVITPVPSSDSPTVTDFVDKVIRTTGIEGARSVHKNILVKDTPALDPLSQGGAMRLIASVALHPGIYHLAVQTMKATVIPNTIETLISVSAAPNTNILQGDNKKLSRYIDSN